MEDKIIELFKQQGGKYLSGEDMSEKLKVTRAAIWKHMEKLRDIGYDIEATPHLGYRLKGIPDKLLPDEIKYGLNTKVFGSSIHSYAETDSTNTLAYGMAEKGAKDGTVVLAEKQAKGKGRLGRKWASPSGGIYMSCIMRPGIAPNEIQEFTLVAALSVARAIKESTTLQARIKWPNDVLLNGKKVCGILTEMKAESDRIDFVVLGIGINANVNDKSLPPHATSLKKELGERVSRIEIVQMVLRSLEKEYQNFSKDGFGPMRGTIKSLSETLGKHIRVTCHDVVYEGEAVDIDEEGALIIRMDTGIMHRVLSGDVVLAR